MSKKTRKSRGAKLQAGKGKRGGRPSKSKIKLGPLETVLLAEGFSRLIDLLLSPGVLGFATTARENLLRQHEGWAAGASDLSSSSEVRMSILQDKLFTEDLLRMVISELPKVELDSEGDSSYQALHTLLVDIYHERDKRHEACIRLGAFFERATLNSMATKRPAAPDRPKTIL